MLLETHQTGPDNVINIDLGFAWNLPQACLECGQLASCFCEPTEIVEFLPTVGCKYCGQRPAMHHPGCCPIKISQVRYGGIDAPDARARHMIQDLRNPNCIKHMIQICTPVAAFRQIIEEGWLEANAADLATPA